MRSTASIKQQTRTGTTSSPVEEAVSASDAYCTQAAPLRHRYSR